MTPINLSTQQEQNLLDILLTLSNNGSLRFADATREQYSTSPVPRDESKPMVASVHLYCGEKGFWLEGAKTVEIKGDNNPIVRQLHRAAIAMATDQPAGQAHGTRETANR